MSSDQSHEDLEAGGEGEKRDKVSETGSVGTVKSRSVSKIESGGEVKSGSLSKTVSPRAVKSGSHSKTVLPTATKIKSVSSVKMESADTVRNGSSRGSPLRLASETSAKRPSAKTSAEKTVSKSSQEPEAELSKEEVLPEVIMEETEVELQGEEPGIRRSGSGARGAGPSSSVVEVGLKKTNMLAQSGLMSVISGTLVSRIYSGIIESVASSHAAGLTDSDTEVSTGTTNAVRSTPVTGSGPQETKLLERSVWKDAEVLDLLGKMRLDALGGNVISSREGSEETLPEGLMTQFDIEEPEKGIDQLMAYKEEISSLKEEFSQAGSLSKTISPSEIPVPELEAERLPTRTVSMDPVIVDMFGAKRVDQWAKSSEPSKESSVLAPEPTPKRLPSPVFCDTSKLTCFTTKEEISFKELSVCRSKSTVEPTVVHVRFRLVTGQILKRFYTPDTIFLDTLCELSQILCVPEDSINLFLKNEPLDLSATVRLCQDPGTEVTVDANVCPDLLFCLLEKGIVSFEDDRALELYLFRQVPCVAERKARRGQPAAPPAPPPHPASFIPGLADHRKRDGAINSELERQLELANCVRWIQSSFRCYLSKRTFPARKEQPSKAHIKAGSADEARSQRNVLMNLSTKDDFTVLYNKLGEWWRHEADAIKKNNSAAAKIARLFKLLLMEIGYIRDIEKHRSKLKERERVERLLGFIDSIPANNVGCNWEYVQGFLSLWKRVQFLPVLKSAKLDCNRNPEVACKVCEHLKCKKCGTTRREIEAAVSSDMDKIIEGRYTRRRQMFRCFCYTCHRFLPCWRFPLYTETARIYSCEKCQGVDNLGRERRDPTGIRSLIENVRKEEMKLGATSWIPYLMQDRDFVRLAALWHNMSALSGASSDLLFVRWAHDEEWSPWNTILLTREEALVHRTDAYGRNFVDTVRMRHLTAKWTFRNLIECEKVMREKYGTTLGGNVDVAALFPRVGKVVVQGKRGLV